MARERQNVDWRNYREEFPDRYTRAGALDLLVEEYLAKQPAYRILTALDVGGGLGTWALKNRTYVDTWLLDPNVPAANWMQGSYTWNYLSGHSPDFNIVVLRGSLNYLNVSQLKRVFALAKGAFFANTFLEPPSEKWTTRSYNSSRGKGIEAFRYNAEKQIIEHVLKLPMQWGDDPEIEHEFNYYEPELLRSLLPGTTFQKHGENSLLIFKTP